MDIAADPTRPPTVPAVFIDKDGTLVENVPFNVDPERMRFTPGAFEALQLLARHGFALIVVTNQPGVALGRFDGTALHRLWQALRQQARAHGVELEGFYACMHAPNSRCACRKPADGLLRRAAREHGIDLARSWMVGDILDDIEAGHRAGCRTVLLDVGNETVWRVTPERTPEHRATDLLDAARFIVAEAARTERDVAHAT